MDYKVVPKIPTKGYPISSPDYPGSHQEANKHEREKYGKRRFKALETIIKERIPNKELAGSHTRKGNILISEKIPEKYHPQIIFHEKQEHRIMERKRRKRVMIKRKASRR